MRVLPLLLLVACAGKAGDTADTAVDLSTFSALQANVLNKSCSFSSCHGSGSGGLDLTEGTAYGALVNATSTGDPSQILVIPGAADNSYLVWKLEAASGIVGDEMPPGGSIDANKIAAIRAWIDAGAPDN